MQLFVNERIALSEYECKDTMFYKEPLEMRQPFKIVIFTLFFVLIFNVYKSKKFKKIYQ